MPSSVRIVEQLHARGVSHVVALPDNTSKALLEKLGGSAGIRVVRVTREGEAWAVAAGLWMGGATPVVLMQNTGFLESGDALRGTAMRMRIPLLCLLTYRGYATLSRRGNGTEVDAATLGRTDIDSCAVVFEPTLRAWGLPYVFVHEDADVGRIGEAFQSAKKGEHPVAVLLTRDTT
jgi:sulfopyruvate decarboxylase TPP-binding subunit